MDATSLELLEFPKVREILASFTSFPASHKLALELMPSPNPQLVLLLLRQSAEARRLLASNPGFSVGGIVDVRREVEMAYRGRILTPSTLLDIQNTLQAARSVCESIKKQRNELPCLWDIASGIVDLSVLETKIRRCLTATGEVLDSASERLYDLRCQLKRVRQELLERLESIIKSRHSEKFLQEPVITIRQGRYVIPVKSDAREEIKGIVHDVSNSGATLFVEPWTVVDLGNRLKELISEEEQEVERILRGLSTEVGAHWTEIRQNVALVAEIDLAFAKARYAEKYNAIEPIIDSSDDRSGDQTIMVNRLRLVAARHPLLGEKAVPLSVEIGGDFSILVISGPNAGGKTVALKTIGLLTLMAQAGMPIPASPETVIPVFDGVFADIGDEQSIERMLSTFSWHMGNIVRIIRHSTSDSLVLLDELGTSTDPVEGVALAQSILLWFQSKGSLVAASTHYSGLKAFAHRTPGFQNASLDFDPHTLKPTYHLTLGAPGGSNALSIASQIGLAPQVVDKAREFMPQGHLEMENILSELTDEKRKVESLRHDLEREKARLVKLRNELEGRLQKLEVEERNMLAQIRDSLLRQAALLERDIRQAAKELKKSKLETGIERARKVLTEVRQELESAAWQVRQGRWKSEEALTIGVGDRVRLIETGLEGVVLSVLGSGRQLEVQAGDIRLTVKVGDVEKISHVPDKVALASPTVRTIRRGKSLLELDLRGKRAEEIEPRLDLFLNDAFVSGLQQVRIIHGFGTGTVRQLVHEFLRGHPLVESFRVGGEGESGGVTVVKLQCSRASDPR